MKTSVDCGTRETFQKMKGVDLFDRVWENLGRYAATGGEVAAKYILSHDNLDRREIEGFIEKTLHFNLKNVCIDMNHNILHNDVTEEYIEGAAYLAHGLAAEDVSVQIGLHSRASAPDFGKRVAEKIKEIPSCPRLPQVL